MFVALGGTGYAAVAINGKNIKNRTIRGSALKNHTLTAKQINKKKLGEVQSARTAESATTAGFASSAGSATSAIMAGNANALGGNPASSYLRTGCGAGKIEGYARILGPAPTFPSTYTSSSAYLRDAFNCSGQAVEVRRGSAGTYFIKFLGNPGALGLGNWAECAPTPKFFCTAVDPRTVAVTQVSGGPDAGAFQVAVHDTTSGASVDDIVDVLIP